MGMAKVQNKNRERNQLVKELDICLHDLAEDEDLSPTPEVTPEVESIRRELINDAGRLISSNKQILEMERDYFANMYDEDHTELNPLDVLPLSTGEEPKISDLHKLRINRPFTTQEFHEALKGLNKNRSLGSDGLSPELYLTFWELLKQEFQASIEFSLGKGNLSEQRWIGIITLIPKKDLNRQCLSNLRPIMLLNADFKILSKALASRIQSWIIEVVHKDQTGFIRGRSIKQSKHSKPY